MTNPKGRINRYVACSHPLLGSKQAYSFVANCANHYTMEMGRFDRHQYSIPRELKVSLATE